MESGDTFTCFELLPRELQSIIISYAFQTLYDYIKRGRCVCKQWNKLFSKDWILNQIIRYQYPDYFQILRNEKRILHFDLKYILIVDRLNLSRIGKPSLTPPKNDSTLRPIQCEWYELFKKHLVLQESLLLYTITAPRRSGVSHFLFFLALRLVWQGYRVLMVCTSRRLKKLALKSMKIDDVYKTVVPTRLSFEAMDDIQVMTFHQLMKYDFIFFDNNWNGDICNETRITTPLVIMKYILSPIRVLRTTVLQILKN